MALGALLFLSVDAHAQSDALPSWNDGPAKKAIVEFVQTTTDKARPTFVPPEARIAAFDQDGTTWVSHPMYTQVVYCLERVSAVGNGGKLAAKLSEHARLIETTKNRLLRMRCGKLR